MTSEGARYNELLQGVVDKAADRGVRYEKLTTKKAIRAELQALRQRYKAIQLSTEDMALAIARAEGMLPDALAFHSPETADRISKAHAALDEFVQVNHAASRLYYDAGALRTRDAALETQIAKFANMTKDKAEKIKKDSRRIVAREYYQTPKEPKAKHMTQRAADGLGPRRTTRRRRK